MAVWSTTVSKESKNEKLTKQKKNKELVSREQTEELFLDRRDSSSSKMEEKDGGSRYVHVRAGYRCVLNFSVLNFCEFLTDQF